MRLSSIYVTKGMSSANDDNIIYDIHLGKSLSGFGQPTCGGKEENVAKGLPPVMRVGAAALCCSTSALTDKGCCGLTP